MASHPVSELGLVLRLLSLYAGPPRGGCYERLDRLHSALADRGVAVTAIARSPPARPVRGLEFVRTSGLIDGLRRAVGHAGAGADAFLAFGSVYAALLRPLLRRRPLITFLRGNWIEQERARGSGAVRLAIARWLEQRGLAASATVFAVSKSAIPEGCRATILPNDAPTLTLPDRAESRARLGLPADAFIAGTLGSIAPVKSVETLIEAVAEEPRLHVALTGCDAEGEYVRGVVAEARSLGPRAHLLGWTPRVTFLSAVDALVVASRHEGSPNGLLEGLAAGRPCVGARSPGVVDILEDPALTFPFGDSAALRILLRELAESPDARRRSTDVATRLAAARRFDWDARAAGAVLQALGRPSAAS